MIPAQQDPAVPNGRLALRGIWVAIIVLTAVLASILTCVVFLAVHAPLAAVIGAPGAIFLGVVGTGVNVVKFLTG
jgi:hypothetical protein